MKSTWNDTRDLLSAKYVRYCSHIFITINTFSQENWAWTIGISEQENNRCSVSSPELAKLSLSMGTACETKPHWCPRYPQRPGHPKKLWCAAKIWPSGWATATTEPGPCNTTLPLPCLLASPEDSTVTAQVLAQLYVGYDTGKVISPPASAPICKPGHISLHH